MKAAPVLIVTALLLGAAEAPPAPGRIVSSGDWAAGCDNGGGCSAVALARAGAPSLLLAITRGGSGTGPARLVLPFPPGTAPGTTLTLEVDGAAVARVVAPEGGGALALPLQAALLKALATGRAATLRDGAGRVAARASLRGLGAALAHMDKARGQPRALPVIRVPAAGMEPPQTLSAAQAARLIGADCAAASQAMTVKAWRLDAAHSLVTVDHPCGAAGFTSVFVLDERGRAAPATFDAPPLGAPAGAGNMVASGGWDAAARRMTSEAPIAGTCTMRQAFAWDGSVFRLARQAQRHDCDGPGVLIEVWRADVTEGAAGG